MPRECVTVHPDKLVTDRSRLEIPYVGAIKKTTHTGAQARPHKPATTPVWRTQHYVCASLLRSLRIFFLFLLNSSRLQAPKSAAATEENGDECSTGFQCGCVCNKACACHRQCSGSGIAPVRHAPLLEGHSSMPVIPDGQCCPCSQWRSCFRVWTSPKTFVSPVGGCNSALQKSSTVGSCGSHRACPSNAALAANCQNYASKEPITRASTAGCHEWILQVSLDEFSQGEGGPVEDKVGNTQTRFMDAETLVHRLSEKYVLPSRQLPEAAGLDLSLAEEANVEPRSQLLVRTDLAVQTTAGTYARIASRSGLAVKHDIHVAAGIADRDKGGNLGVILVNNGPSPFLVSQRDRIAQLIVERSSICNVVEVYSLPPSVWAAQGFGSSGVRPDLPQMSHNNVCRSLQGEDCICTKLRAVRPSELGPIGPPNEVSVDEGSMEFTVPSCVVEPVTYDSDTESQGISDVEPEGPEVQAVPDCFAGGWSYCRDHPDGVSNHTHPNPEPPHHIQTSGKTPESNAGSLAGSFRSMRKDLRDSISSRARRRALGLQHRRGCYSLTPEIFTSIIEWAGECTAV